MNPDTKLTTEQLKIICARHNIPYHSHVRITTGFSHEVHRVNDDLVIKLFNSNKNKVVRRFKTERALLASRAPFRKPQLVASAASDDVIDRSYVIMTYVPGLSLGSRWHEANDDQRQNLIREICESLKIISRIEPADIELVSSGNWRESVVERGEGLVAKLSATGTIDQATADLVLQTTRDSSRILDGTEVLPVYWDVHFDNFIVNEKFELQALIDMENVQLTSLDYPLFVIQKQTDEPEKYLREEDEHYADRRDYVRLREWYRMDYPEMFAFNNLEARVRLYLLLDTLHLLIDWPQVEGLYRKLEEFLGA